MALHSRFCLMASVNCPKCACFAVICSHKRTTFVPVAVLVIHLSAVGTDGEAIESIRRASGCLLSAIYLESLRAVSAPAVHAMQYQRYCRQCSRNCPNRV